MGSGQSNPDGSTKTIYDHINYHLGNVGKIATSLTSAVGSAKDALGSFSSTASIGTSGRGEHSGGFFDGGAAENDNKPLASIIAYRQSKSHESKQALAEKLIQALKIAGVTVRENGDIADIAKAILEKLPNPHKGQSYKIESESQKNVLSALVKGLNESFTPGAPNEKKLIPTSYGLEEIARQALELVYSMTTGVHDEFLTVQASVVNALHNVKVLRKLMDSAHNEVVSQANRIMANPDRNTTNYDAYQEIYKRIANECDRQIDMLSNMLDATMGPEMNVMQQLADETSADYKYIKKYVIGNDMDLKTSASVMAHLVHGIAATAVMITAADKTFEELGGQMMNLKGATEEAVDKAIDDLIRKKPSDAAKYIKWKGIIKMYNEEHKIRNDTMDKMGMRNNDSNIRVRVGAADLIEERKSKYATNYTKNASEKRIIFSDYISKSSASYAKLLAAVDTIGPRIGSEIPISDKLMDLREAFSALADTQLGGGGLEKALIGFDLETTSRQLRDAFMNRIRLVKTVLDQIVGMSVYSGVRQYFDPMISIVSSMVEQADMYYDIVKQKYGSKEGGADGDDDYQLPEVARSAHDLRKSVNSFVYYMYVAKVKENLKQTHSEVESYGENYTQLLGEAVACRLKTIKKEYEEQTKKINDAFATTNIQQDVQNVTETQAKAAALPLGQPTLNNYAYKVNQEQIKEECKKYSKKHYECKKNFYLALQAVDLYLKEFTEGVTAHPEDIADIKQMLTGVDLIGPWYDDKTGDHLAKGFDMFSSSVVGIVDGQRPFDIWTELKNNGGNVADNNVLTVGGGHPINLILAKAGYTVGSINLGDIVDTKDLVAAIAGAPGMAGAADHPRIGNKHYYENLRVSNNHLGIPNEQFNLLLKNHRILADFAVKQFAETYNNFQALKNIINAIVRMGDKFGNKELRDSIFMSPNEIFKNLMGYLKCSATSFKFVFDDGAAAGQGFTHAPTATLGVGSVSSTEFLTEDNYFQMIVKAMATKILTVMGVYDLFNRPGPVYDLTPTRMIIGGAVGDRPEIIPDATELYFRLTRLAEYYRADALNYNNTLEKQIGFIPDVAGVFAGFVKLMWLKLGSSTVNKGNYSETELQQIIAEINSIYHHFQSTSEHSIATTACNEFVMEINRRYGIVKKSDYENFYKMMRASSTLGERGDYNNFAILPDEGKLRAKRAAPSDMFLLMGKDSTTDIEMKCDTDLDTGTSGVFKDMLNQFRNKLNTSFSNARDDTTSNYNKFLNVSYSVRIKQAADKMRKESENERYSTVGQLIRGSDGLASTDLARDYFFHETVVTGLSTLTAAIKMLEHINNQVTFMKEHAVAAGGGGAVNFNELELTLSTKRNPAIQLVPAAANNGMLRDIITLVNGLNNSFGGKVTVRFPQGKESQLLVDFTDLGNYLTELLESIKYFMNLMRQFMPEVAMKKYEGATIADEGSYKYVDSRIATIVRGEFNRYSADALADEPEPTGSSIFDTMANNINLIYTRIVHNYHTNNVDIAQLVWYDHNAPIRGYNNAAPPVYVGGAPVAVPLTSNGLEFLIANKPPTRPPGGGSVVPTRTYFNQIERVWNGKEINNNKGMMFLFNQLLSMYLTQFYDASSGKIYRGLIENFASGSFNQAITDTEAQYVFKDLFATGADTTLIASSFGKFVSLYTTTLVDNAKLFLTNMDGLAAVGIQDLKFRAIVLRTLAAGQPTINEIEFINYVHQVIIAVDLVIGVQCGAAGPFGIAAGVIGYGGGAGANFAAAGMAAIAAFKVAIANAVAAVAAVVPAVPAAGAAGIAAVDVSAAVIQNTVVDPIVVAMNALGAAVAAGAAPTPPIATVAGTQASAAILNAYVSAGAVGGGSIPLATAAGLTPAYALNGANMTAIQALLVVETVKVTYLNPSRPYIYVLPAAATVNENAALNVVHDRYLEIINNEFNLDAYVLVEAVTAAAAAAADNVFNTRIRDIFRTMRDELLLAAANSLLGASNLPTQYDIRSAQNAITQGDKDINIRSRENLAARQAKPNLPGAQINVDALGPGVPPANIVAVATDVNNHLGGVPQYVLLQSLALILQRLMTDQTREGVSERLVSTISEVPMYIRERMRAYLPVFSKMFTMVQQQGELIKQMLEQTNLVLTAARDRDIPAERTERDSVITCINKIIDGCYTLANSASDVCRELADEPKFLQTQENSIRDYQSRYGKLPLMPLSSSLNYLTILQFPAVAQGTEYLLPIHTLGTPEFKMMYGVRGLFTDATLKSSSAPGVQHALEMYRSSSNATVDDAKYEKLTGCVVGITRALVDLRYYSSILGYVDAAAAVAAAGGGGGLVAYAAAGGVLHKGEWVFRPVNMFSPHVGKRSVYQITDAPLQPRVLALTESSAQSAQMQDIAGIIDAKYGDVDNANSRAVERMYNIVDMNIIPINVHALMRGIPLAPLYNYTYTFEENARLALGLTGKVDNEPINAREWFYKILEDPYFDSVSTNTTLNIQTQAGVLPRLLVGPGSIQMANPAPLNGVNARKVANRVKELATGVSTMLRGKSAQTRLAVAVISANRVDIANNAILDADVGNDLRDHTDTAIAVAIRKVFYIAADSVPIPAAGVTQANEAAVIAIAAVHALTELECIAIFDNVSVASSTAVGGGAGVRPAPANVAGAAIRARVVAVAENLITELIIARESNKPRLNAAMVNTINTTIAKLIITAPGNEPTDVHIQTVAGILMDVRDNNAGAVATFGVVQAAVMGVSPVGLIAAAVAHNVAAANVLMQLAYVSVLTATVNNLSNNLGRYSLNRRVIEDDRTLASLMHGDETLLMGRPKFISDQLFHKVLPTVDEAGNLNYYEKGLSLQVPVAAPADRVHFRDVFETRFNTRIVRNLMHCTNVQRVLRLRLNQELTSYRDVLVNRESITNPSVTEFGNLRWSDMRLGPGTDERRMDPRNENVRSRTYNDDPVGIPR
jgi:hypothetical protein